MAKDIKSEICKLRKKSTIAYLASVNEAGFPQTKAMLVLERAGVKEHYFSTNTSSQRVQQLLKNPKASVYYCKPNRFKGALFTGTVQVCTDRATKALLWRRGFERYYPGGIDDEDYCVLKFTAETVNYYDGKLKNTTLKIEELTDNG